MFSIISYLKASLTAPLSMPTLAEGGVGAGRARGTASMCSLQVPWHSSNVANLFPFPPQPPHPKVAHTPRAASK